MPPWYRDTPGSVNTEKLRHIVHAGVMKQDAPQKTCTLGHPMTYYGQGSNRRLRCPTCRSASESKRKRDRATECRRESRARLRQENPELYRQRVQADTARKKARINAMSPEEFAVFNAKRTARAVKRTANERIARSLSVSPYIYSYLQKESEMSSEELVRDNNRPSAPWNLLKVKPDALPAWEDFSTALETTATPCQGSEKWVEYDDPRAGREDEATGTPMPTRGQARQMCAACPLLDLCGEFAAKEKPDWGIWGGRAYLGGKAH